MPLDTDLARLVEEEQPSPGTRCLLYKATNNPTVAIHGSILAGTSSEPSGKPLVAELNTRLFIRGTRRRGPGKIANLLESVRPTAPIDNSQDSIVLQARMTSQRNNPVLEIVADVLSRPALAPQDVES